MSTLCFRILRMPSESVVVATVGSPSGTAATAREIEIFNICRKPYPLSRPIRKTIPQTAPLMSTSCPPILSSCLSIGVCGGLAEYFNIDSTLVRLSAVALTPAGGSGILAYLIFWFVVSQRPLNLSSTDSDVAGQPSADVIEPVNDEHNEGHTAALFVGVLLTVLGFLFLIGNFISLAWLSFTKLWPLVLIAIGLLIVLKGSGRKQNAN